MPQYVIRLCHSSDQCPSSNSKIRERLSKGASEMQNLAQKLGVRFVAGPLVLPTEHVGLAVVEAERIEAVEDLVVQSGLSQWNTVQLSAAKPMAEAIKDLEKAPPPLY